MVCDGLQTVTQPPQFDNPRPNQEANKQVSLNTKNPRYHIIGPCSVLKLLQYQFNINTFHTGVATRNGRDSPAAIEIRGLSHGWLRTVRWPKTGQNVITTRIQRTL
ncbi:hypothetical protein VFPPC_15246 [Pochonia chlamydosporia 170]|uniref:Uncharacterized protein n=1 Tax=Pochonia chlamydosporia 170 TaxID=1380566 RepID=A0A179G5H7_METCM|nr:hypothetical protein VFPPC_15246 [Pochonia chlamydosporia 170]OAQ73076.1 hypothetical protein VFPPC_15246 [Pochonia chlamydosporia 170]